MQLLDDNIAVLFLNAMDDVIIDNGGVVLT